MPQAAKSAQQAMKIAREVITEAGYDKIKITNAEYDEDEDEWVVDAEDEDGTIFTITIDAGSGEVTDFLTE